MSRVCRAHRSSVMIMKGKGVKPFARHFCGNSTKALLLIVLLLSLVSCRRTPSGSQEAQKSDPSPPDLTACTRIEIRYMRSVLEYGFHGTRRKSVLSEGELSYVRSLDPIVLEQPDRIKAFAQSIRLGTYYDVRQGVPGVADVVQVTCSWPDRRALSFVGKRGPFIRLGDGTWFDYTKAPFDPLDSVPEIRPLLLRAGCADNLGTLMGYWSPQVGGKPSRPSQDEVNTWCDATVLRVSRRHFPEYVALCTRYFQCPSAGEGRCHYAVNPDCTLASPRDTVFLFETKSGWNQHGGPELFTFDNHDPKGGCVLLNDGTVKFIHTEEELKQLRWK